MSLLPAPSPAVLLIGDDPTERSIALSMLRHLGVEADAAASGPMGLERAAGAAFDVALVAVPLVGLDAVAAARSLRASGVRRVVALTPQPAGEAEALGFDAAFQTPLSVALLAEAIAQPVAATVGGGEMERRAAPAMVARPRPAEATGTAALVATVRAHVTMLLGEEDEAFVQELASSFAESAREAAEAATAARAAADVEGVARAAHALKGSASNVGLDVLTATWAEIEEHLHSGAVPDALLAEAIAETERTASHLAAAFREGA